MSIMTINGTYFNFGMSSPISELLCYVRARQAIPILKLPESSSPLSCGGTMRNDREHVVSEATSAVPASPLPNLLDGNHSKQAE